MKRLIIGLLLVLITGTVSNALPGHDRTKFVYGPQGGYNDAHVVSIGGRRWIDVNVDGSGPSHEWRLVAWEDGELHFESASVRARQLKLTENEYWLKEPTDSGFVRKYFGRTAAGRR